MGYNQKRTSNREKRMRAKKKYRLRDPTASKHKRCVRRPIKVSKAQKRMETRLRVQREYSHNCHFIKQETEKKECCHKNAFFNKCRWKRWYRWGYCNQSYNSKNQWAYATRCDGCQQFFVSMSPYSRYLHRNRKTNKQIVAKHGRSNRRTF